MNRAECLQRIQEYLPHIDMERVTRAYDFGDRAHDGQLRKGGGPYFMHPVAVAVILAELEMDEDTIIAGLLHDTIEDTAVKSEEIEREFGAGVAKLVEGVTKLSSVSFETKQERQVENLRKMFIAIASDLRVIIVKLADRLHNMRTLDAMEPNKQVEISEETLYIYAPIAHRLGIFRFKWELEDISLKYIDPEGYKDLVQRVNKKRSERESVINTYIEQLREEMSKADIECEIYGRPKNFYSIYKKMKYKMKEFDEIYDLTAIRIILVDEKKLYAALGVVHSMWNFIPGRFKDYVSTPKQNMYRSLHTTLMGKNEPFEIQIRTREMHEQAEYGVAAHWKYKEGTANRPLDDVDQKIQWFRQMMELQNDLKEPGEFMDSLKYDILSASVYVFTPNGEIINLPKGSTPIDFAYRIHSEVGNNATGAKVNGRIVPLNYHLSNGQIVEIQTQKNGPGPSRDWLKFVKSTQAKQKIRQWFKKERREENIERGQDMLHAELKRYGIPTKVVVNDAFLEPILQRLSLKSIDDMYNALGYGGILTSQVVSKVREKLAKEEKDRQAAPAEVEPPKIKPRPDARQSKTGVIVKGMDDILVRFAKCCTPVPGDPIIGYITRGRGVTVHRADCENFEKSEDTDNRFIEVAWADAEEGAYYASIAIVAVNRKGVMSEITSIVAGLDMQLTGLHAKVDKNELVTINLSVEIRNIEELNKLFKRLKSIQDIVEIKRTSA